MVSRRQEPKVHNDIEIWFQPSRRVMPCMVSLPDGTVMILNGAHHGTAGFGLAEDPNLNAILYDPTKPVGSRFSILGNTIVARLYHSEATLLPDGRVLVSGSDPQTNNPDGTVKYPEEYRIEVIIILSLSMTCLLKVFHRFTYPHTSVKASDSQPLSSPGMTGLMAVPTPSPMSTSSKEPRLQCGFLLSRPPLAHMEIRWAQGRSSLLSLARGQHVP